MAGMTWPPLRLFKFSGRTLIYLAILAIPVANAPITGDTLEVKMHMFRLMGVAAAFLYALIAFHPNTWMYSHPFREFSEARMAQLPRTGAAECRPMAGIDLAVLIGMVSLVGSLIFSESRVAALPGALDASASLAFFLLARSSFSGASLTPIMVVIGLSTLLPGLMFIAEINHTGITDTLGNQNVVSHYLLLSLCAPIYAVTRSRGWKRMAWVLFLLATGWVIWRTAARGAVVGALVGVTAVGILQAARSWRGWTIHRRMVAAAVCAGIFLAPAFLLHKYATSGDFNVNVRFLSWKYSISLLSDHLWFGYGPGLFSTSFEKTKLWMSDEDARLLGLLSVNYAHNDYVELMVDQGAAGLAAFLFLILACLDPPGRRWGGSSASIALMFSLTAGLAQAFFDFPFHTPAPRMLFHVLLALIAIADAAADPEEEAPFGVKEACGSAILVGLSILPALPVLTTYAASAVAKVAEPRFKSGQYNAVKHLHEWSAELDPTRSLYPFRQALGEEMAMEFDRAGQTYRATLALQPYFPNLYFHLGTIAMHSNPSRAAASFYANIAFYQTHSALHNLAAQAMSIGDSSSAASLYEEISRRYPDDDRARHNASVLKMPENQLRPEAYRRALDWYQQGRLDMAQSSVEAHLRQYPSDPEGVFLLGRVLFHRGGYPESEKQFARYLKFSPNDAEGHYYLASAHFFQNRYQDAQRSYAAGARINPDSPKIIYNLGVTYYMLGDAAAMNDCFDTVLTINPNVSFKPKMDEIRRMPKRQKQP